MNLTILSLTLLGLLFIKHFLADFVFQSNTMVIEKGIYGKRGGIEHSLIHAMMTFIVLLAFIPMPYAFVLGLVDGVIHYHIDWAKININKKKNLTPATEAFWFWLGVDQLLHALTYIGIVIWLVLEFAS